MSTLTSALIVRLVDRVSGPARNVSRNILGIQRAVQDANQMSFGDRLNTAIRRNNAALAHARGGLFDAVAGFYTLQAAIAAPVQAAMQFETAMADVAKVVDDFDTSTEAGREAFGQFQQELRALSREIPLTTRALAEIAAAAGEAGFSADQLIPLTDAAARIAVAFGSSAEETGAMLASMQQSYGMSFDEAMRLSDAMNHLSNNMASNAPSLMNFWTRIAADAGQAGFSHEQALALGSAMVASGHGADVAATSFRNMARALTRGESATARQRDAYARLGLDAAAVAEQMQKDAVGTTRAVLQRIASLPEAVRSAVSSDLFGNEARALGSIATNLEFFDRAISAIADESAYAGSAFAEFEIRAGTFASKLQIFQNRVADVVKVIGDALIPILADLIKAVSPFVDQIAQFITMNSALVGGLAAAVAGLVAFKAALAGLRFVGLLGRGGVLSLLALGMNTVGRAAGGALRAARSMVALQTALAAMQGTRLSWLQRLGFGLRGMVLAVPGVGLLSGVLSALAGTAAAVGTAIAGITAPVWGGIAIAVAAVAAAGALLWKYWDRITAVLSGVARRLGEQLQPAFDAIRPVLAAIAPVTDAVGAAFGRMKAAIDAVIAWFQTRWNAFRGWIGGFFQREVLTDAESAALEQRGYDMADNVINAIKGVFDGLRQIGVDAVNALWDGMKTTFETVMAWIRNIPASLIEAVGNIDLSAMINWPEPPGWWNALFGDDEVAVPMPGVTQGNGFARLSAEQQDAARTLEGAQGGDLPTADNLAVLREYAALYREEIAALQGEIDNLADGPTRDIIVAPMADKRETLHRELQALEQEIADGEAQAAALMAALQVLSETGTTPEINTESIDQALHRVRALSATMNRLGGATGPAPGPTVAGARAGGGPVTQGKTYLVGEDGQELFTPSRDGFIHNARDTMRMLSGSLPQMAAGPGSIPLPDFGGLMQHGTDILGRMAAQGAGIRAGPQLNITAPLIGSVSIAQGEDPMQVVDQLAEALESRLAQAMRGTFTDGSL